MNISNFVIMRSCWHSPSFAYYYVRFLYQREKGSKKNYKYQSEYHKNYWKNHGKFLKGEEQRVQLMLSETKL